MKPQQQQLFNCVKLINHYFNKSCSNYHIYIDITKNNVPVGHVVSLKHYQLLEPQNQDNDNNYYEPEDNYQPIWKTKLKEYWTPPINQAVVSQRIIKDLKNSIYWPIDDNSTYAAFVGGSYQFDLADEKSDLDIIIFSNQPTQYLNRKGEYLIHIPTQTIIHWNIININDFYTNIKDINDWEFYSSIIKNTYLDINKSFFYFNSDEQDKIITFINQSNLLLPSALKGLWALFKPCFLQWTAAANFTVEQLEKLPFNRCFVDMALGIDKLLNRPFDHDYLYYIKTFNRTGEINTNYLKRLIVDLQWLQKFVKS